MAHPRPDDAQDHKLDDDGTGQQHEGGQDVGSLAEDGLRCAAEQVAARRDGGGGHGVGQLSGDMVDVAAVGTGGSHDGGVGDGRAVVAADRAGQAGGDGDHQHLTLRERMADDGHEDGEGTPRSAGGEGEEDGHEEDDDGQQVLQRRSGAAEQAGDVVITPNRAAGNRLLGFLKLRFFHFKEGIRMELNKKAAYLQGLVDGLGIDDTTKEGKIIKAMSALLGEMAEAIESVDEDLSRAYDQINDLSDELEDLEADLYEEDEDGESEDAEDEDTDDDDDAKDDDIASEPFYEVA